MNQYSKAITDQYAFDFSKITEEKSEKLKFASNNSDTTLLKNQSSQMNFATSLTKKSDPEESEDDLSMSFAHWETNNDFTFVINLQEQIKNKYLTVFVIESKSLKCELRQLRKITRQESRNALFDQTEIVEHALYLSLDATNEIK